MKVRLLALNLTAWVTFYGWVYVVSMRDQGSTPYWWYLAIIGAGAVPPLLTAVGLRLRFLLICDAVVLGVAAHCQGRALRRQGHPKIVSNRFAETIFGTHP